MHYRHWLLKVSKLCMRDSFLDLRSQRYISNLRKRIPRSDSADSFNDAFNNGRNRRRWCCSTIYNDVFWVHNKVSYCDIWFLNLSMLHQSLLLHLEWQTPRKRCCNYRLRFGNNYAPSSDDGQYDWSSCEPVTPSPDSSGFTNDSTILLDYSSRVQSKANIWQRELKASIIKGKERGPGISQDLKCYKFSTIGWPRSSY